MKKLMAICLIAALLLATSSVVLAADTDARKAYSISNIAANGGVLWSANTVKKMSAYNSNFGSSANDYIKRVASPTISGSFTTRLYETDKSTQAMPNPLFNYDGSYDIDSLYAKYATEYNGGTNRSFYMKFSNDTAYALKSAGYYCVGYWS